MKIKIDIDTSIDEDEVIIHCRELTEEILQLEQQLSKNLAATKSLLLSRQGTDYFIKLNNILFFETSEKIVYAHTCDSMYETTYKLYELEEVLPGFFMRISKSAIVNLNEIFSIARNLTASSSIEFLNTKKTVYVSRQYYKSLMDRINERRKSM